VRDFTQTDLKGTLQAIKDMGYNAVELAGTYGLPAAEFKNLLNDIGLTAYSAHVGIGEFEPDAKATVEKYAALGCKYIAIPWMELPDLPGGENWASVRDKFQQIAELCNAFGIKLMYHNHDFEFNKLPNGEYILDELFNDVPQMDAEIDTGWVAAVGLCPAEYIKKYAGRCPIVHLKDTIKTETGMEDRPVGQGSQNMPLIIESALESGTHCFVTELDNAHGITSMEAAKQSLEFLKKLEVLYG